MQDVTNEMMNFRECVRSLWNSYFRELEGGWHEFIPVQRELFHALVLAQVFGTHGVGRPEYDVWVVPKLGPQGVNALWAIEREDTRAWSEVRLHVEMRLKYHEFFDWSDEGYSDLALVRCEIIESSDPCMPEGQLLLDVRLVQFEVDQ